MTQGGTVWVVDDDAAVGASLAAVLESWGYGVRVFDCGEAFLAEDLVSACCILLDVRLPQRDGISVLKAFRARGAQTPVIVMTGHGDVDMAVRAIHTGAQDFIEKPFDDSDLITRIRRAIDRQDTADRADVAPFMALTPREREVLAEVLAGHPNKIIAYRLGISQKTVELHRARVMRKTGAKSLSHLVRMAVSAGVNPEASNA